MRTLTLALLLCTSPLLAQKTPASSADDKSMILALESAWNQAEIHHDATAAAAIMADSFISVDHHGALQNKAQYLAGLKDLSFKPEEIANSDTSVYLYGNVAVVTSVSHQGNRQRQTLRSSRTLYRYLGKTEWRMEVRRRSGNPDPLTAQGSQNKMARDASRATKS